MPLLLRGELPLSGYLRLLINLRAVYAALEPALDRHAQHPLLAPLRLPGLVRLAALDADIAALCPQALAEPSGAATVVPAARRYAERLRHLADQQPALLAAHAYLRYLGDLSGGQVLGRIVARTYAKPDKGGSRFYDFGSAEQARLTTIAFRDALEALPVTAEEADALVAETAWGYQAHAEMFEQLAVQDEAHGREAEKAQGRTRFP